MRSQTDQRMGLYMKDWKMRDQNAAVDNAGPILMFS